MIRLFVALPLSDQAADALAPMADGLRGADWSPREKLHVTLRFIGEVDEAAADDLDLALSRVRGAPFTFNLAGAGCFDGGGRLNAVWAGVEINAALKVLRGRCDRAARQAGLDADPRAWKPHVTLAYLHGAEPEAVMRWIAANNLFRFDNEPATGFGLYSSHPGRDGAVYRLERWYSFLG